MPYINLGLIVIDEEHDQSYKQEDITVYNARDMSVLRGYYENFPVILCSATPSLETYYNAINGKYLFIELSSRFGPASLPEVNIINMLEEKLPATRWISPTLHSAITESLKKGDQVLLFLNRRGYAPLMLCRNCGFRHSCNSCSTWLVLHKSAATLECHHCGFTMPFEPHCPSCNDNDLAACGPGVERILEEVTYLFPEFKVSTITKDTMHTPTEINNTLRAIENKEIDIIIGTQIISKGYHFSHLNLVGVIDADIGFHGADLKSLERTYQLLYQTSGRAGREGENSGKVYLQTYMPDSVVINSIKNYDEKQFINYELTARQAQGMPPFSKVIALHISGKSEESTLQFALNLVSLSPVSEVVKILGPAPALISRIKRYYRFKILVISPKKYNIQEFVQDWIQRIKIPASIKLKVDVDPYNFI